MSRLSPRAVPAKRPPARPQVPRETFGMLRLRGFSLTVYCDPCKDVSSSTWSNGRTSPTCPSAASTSNASSAGASGITG